jgi:hypothetical protein
MKVRWMILLGAATLLPACGDGSGSSSSAPAASSTPAAALPQGSEPVTLDPATFTTTIDNPFWPLTPGSRWVYRETDRAGNVQRVVVTVTPRNKEIIGITAVVVHDQVTEDGQVVEDTYDWYAQDSEGNVWYLGEDTTEFENGKPKTTEGSWQAGVDGAQPGVIMPAHPEVGQAYREEYLQGQAEDQAGVLSTAERASVPFGEYQQVVVTRNFTPLDPKLVEHKFYASGVGQVLALTVSGGGDREELVSYRSGAS